MTLAKLLNKKKLNILGLNSGTSADSLDIAAVEIKYYRGQQKIRFLKGFSNKFPKNIKFLIRKISDSDNQNISEILLLDNMLGDFFGKCARQAETLLLKQKISIDVIASHGQTVRHIPGKLSSGKFKTSASLQLGSLAFISSVSKKITVGNFRQADIARKGEGAPITTLAMKKIFADPEQSRLIVNIGGISNYFYFPQKSNSTAVLAADCGPGNSLSDILAWDFLKQEFDNLGKTASKGKISTKLLRMLTKNRFFTEKRKSTGLEDFGRQEASKIKKAAKKMNLSPKDIMATVVELTAVSISNSVNKLIKKNNSLSKLYLTGGGRKNIFLVKRIKVHLPDIEVLNVEELNIDGDFVEAVCFAILGEAALRSKSLNFQSGIQSNGRVILGEIAQPDSN